VIRLVALNQETSTQTTLDLEGAPSISLNLAVAKPGETMQRHAPYSQTFRLPFTDRNNVFFSHFYEVTLSDGDFDPTQKTEVLIFEDGVQVIRGAMQLRAVRLMAEVYEVNVLGDVADLFAEMGSKLVRDAFKSTPSTYITSYNYANTATNVIDSQDLANNICQNPAAMDDGTVIVPLADHGLRADTQPLVAQSGYGLMDSAALETGLFPDMLKPAIRLHEVVDRILVSNGFYYESDFLESAYFKTIYMTLAGDTERPPATAAGQMKAVCQFGTNSFTDADTGWNKVPFNNVVNYGGFDTDENFSTASNAYICAQAGTHSFAAKVRFRLLNAGAGESVDVIARISRGPTSIGSTTLTLTTENDDITVQWAASAVCGLADGVQVEFKFADGQLQSGTTLDVTGQGIEADDFAYSHFYCTFAPGGIVNVPQAMPRIKQKELFSDLAQRFNLVIEAAPDDPKKLFIEPYVDWIADGVDAYWTDKLDMDKERTLMPTSSLKSARIALGDKDSGDVGNAYMTSTLGRVFGTYTQEIDDEFTTGELKNAPVFAPFFVYPVPTLQGDPVTDLPNVLIHRSYELDGAGVKPKTQPPKLFHAAGLTDTLDTLYVGGSALTQYQLCSPYEDSPADADSRHLFWNNSDRVFSADHDLIAGNPPGLGGYHKTYWQSYLADIYDPEARIFEAHLYLTPSDIRNVRFNDRFHILGATYKLTEISGYEIGTGESVKCKFLRDIGRGSFGACQNVPSTSNANGTVTFVDPDGVAVTDPGVVCCEAFGYFYDEETNTCRWQNPDAGEGDPVPPYPPTDATDPFPNDNGGGPGPVSPTGITTTNTDTTSGTSTLYDDFFLTTETKDNSSARVSAPKGAAINVDENTIATGVVRVNSTTVGGSAGTAFTSKFETWRFLADGRAGTVSYSATSGTTFTSGSPGTRRSTASLSDGQLIFNVIGEANQIINWALKVEMVRIYATNEVEYRNAILTEGGARLAGINDRVLIQE